MGQKAINSPELFSSPVVAVSSLLVWWKVMPHHKPSIGSDAALHSLS